MKRTPRRNWPVIAQLKKQAVVELENGAARFALDVRGLSLPERNIVRSYCNRWMRNHDKRGAIRFDPDAWTLTVTVSSPVGADSP